MIDLSDYAKLTHIGPDLIELEIESTDEYERSGISLELGALLAIEDDAGTRLVASVQSYRIRDRIGPAEEGPTSPTFTLSLQPMGRMVNGKFTRGGNQITIPPKRVTLVGKEALTSIYGGPVSPKRLVFSHLVQDPNVEVGVNGDRLFGKHVAILGSSGSGKSSTVAAVIQAGIRGSEDGVLNNAHSVMFDLHGEYSSAFPDARTIQVDDMALPYWLLTADELESMFIESNEQNSHNQVSQFRRAVILNKRRHNPSLDPHARTYDSPVFFDLGEVVNYLSNLNSEVISKIVGEGLPKLTDGRLITSREDSYFTERLNFIETSTANATRASNGPFGGEFNRLLMRLEATLDDPRLAFILSPRSASGEVYGTADFAEILSHITGYSNNAQTKVTIIDLSGVPFEMLSIVVALVTRLIFTFCFLRKKESIEAGSELPYLLVYEEAHNYVSRNDAARFAPARKAIERVAKEGRKYGVAVMVVSQRPSEISETVLSQCSNFIVMRLTNPSDQQYVRRLLPDELSVWTAGLPSLEQQEAVIIGDAVSMPTLVRVDDIADLPASADVPFLQEWRKRWLELSLKDVTDVWRR
ncbi:ATP-binding protein [Curtobacterium sp. Leaf261]|uniref:ATP-binding protein n=1 Tax=Curtobacterium sp. Leaf261 TaxID=1736311 RepID=UPI0009E9B41A|nr:DUF87 domain-containing protein [Curtobacterium sp. Leaf261]